MEKKYINKEKRSLKYKNNSIQKDLFYKTSWALTKENFLKSRRAF